ncbi:PUA-like domain-containing protein [Boletus reticuloceps]|uniref:PUA-like domain-containing protein n=1 Tax=Boletus reticuloceps TaxID=495285 RepID=A0A8I2YSM5_9AGAM|nr:PUA-like domain-containing protein [Boletus reticuloceps]
MEESTRNYWLMKAEPHSRVVKGKDFGIDDFEAVEFTPWEGVRNYEARNLMKEMVLGDKILFYHSNCKNPGIAGFAEVSKEAYPDRALVADSTIPLPPTDDPLVNRHRMGQVCISVILLARNNHAGQHAPVFRWGEAFMRTAELPQSLTASSLEIGQGASQVVYGGCKVYITGTELRPVIPASSSCGPLLRHTSRSTRLCGAGWY